VLNPKEKSKFIANKYPCLKPTDVNIDYVQHLIYLGHIITDNMSDYENITPEVRNMFYSTNVLVGKFYSCSPNGKLTLFRAY